MSGITPIIHPDTIKVIAEMNGFSKLKTDMAKFISVSLEHRIKYILEDAQKVMKHSRRDVLSTTDINYALRLSNLQPLYGHITSEPLRFVRSNNDSELYVEEEKEIDFSTILASELPPCPRECTFDITWLAIEGKQPDIPQIPRVKRKLSDMEATDQAPVREVKPKGVNQARAEAAAIMQARQARAKALAEQTQVVEESKPTAVPPLKRKAYEPRTVLKAAPPPKVPPNEIFVNPAIPHELSKEVQVYFTKLEEAILGTNNIPQNLLEKNLKDVPVQRKLEAFLAVENVKKIEWKDIFFSLNTKNHPQIRMFVAALQSLCQDPGLYKLLPYLIEFVCTNAPKHINNLSLLKSLMQVTALSLNSYIEFEMHISQLLPVMLTCVVREQLGTDTMIEHHWTLRDYCALLVSNIVRRNNKPPDLEARVTKFFVDHVINLNKPPTAHYGALQALSLIGPHCIKIVVFPLLDKFVPAMRERLHNTKSPTTSAEIMQCLAALLENTGKFIQNTTTLLGLEALKTREKMLTIDEHNPTATTTPRKKKRKEKTRDNLLPITSEDCINDYKLVQTHFEAGLLPYTGHITHYVDFFI